MLTSLTEKVEATLQRYAGQRLCVGFSGGLDSSVLLHVLAQLAPQVGFSLSVVHVHHGLSPHADAWATHCERVASELGVPLAVHRVQVERDGEGLEAAARRARHAVFAEVDADWIVLAHHRNDQVETVLHRLMRGTGVHGVGAMLARDDARRILRPLLDVSRNEIEAYAREHRLEWIEDESNRDTRFTRNFLRHELLPLWSQRQAGLETNLARAAGLFAEAAALLDVLASEDAARVAPGTPGARQRLASLDEARARNLLRYLLVQAGCQPPQSHRLAEALRQIVDAEEGVRLPFDKNMLCAWRDLLWLETIDEELPQEIIWRGEPQLVWGSGRVMFREAEGEEALRISPDGSTHIVQREGGERLRLRADGPSRAFKQMCQEAGIPPWLRQRLPVLRRESEAGSEVMWIGGLGATSGARCAEGERGWLVEWRDAPILAR
ncbi:MAG TPA: tRNA lysidine(34) synthetase TilS [Rhodocyclaceae bacterium]|nr:tRNA lysidine(34) synthetase TilS [Rhodocyclaceae bacterium]